jgi:hypothetical protein
MRLYLSENMPQELLRRKVLSSLFHFYNKTIGNLKLNQICIEYKHRRRKDAMKRQDKFLRVFFAS